MMMYVAWYDFVSLLLYACVCAIRSTRKEPPRIPKFPLINDDRQDYSIKASASDCSTSSK